MAWNKALLICSLVATVATKPLDVDCTHRQDFQTVRGCCSYPTLRFEQFRKQCGRYMPTGSPKVSPCLYECIFNATNILKDSLPDSANTRAMLETLLGNNQDFVEAYLDGMMNCSDTVQDMMKHRRPRHSGGTDYCSPVAVFYGICTQKYVFNNCPSSSWSGSESCEMARLENLNCPSARQSRGARAAIRNL
ncbi:uncharacterized protein Obp50c [Drosophila kikkawai]|uniref:Uncharacterized protein Obp50c n=1 Tax=Drosophila kikkawai TaxID=30033 RepID=A0A6P4IHM8_DROKI|nr:uncharacterized protein LOC108074664 [Drosophila kikkawai]